MTGWRDVVSDSRSMTGTCDTFKMFSFSVTQSTFRFPMYWGNLAVPTTSLIYSFWHLRTVDSIFVGKKGLDAMSAFENHPSINAAIEFFDAGLRQLFYFVPLNKVELRWFPFWELWWLDFSVCFAVCSKHHWCCNWQHQQDNHSVSTTSSVH